jgi:hypothetical protein
MLTANTLEVVDRGRLRKIDYARKPLIEVKAATLLGTDFERLVRDDINALRVPTFISPESATKMAAAILCDHRYGRYENAPTIGRVGRALFETNHNHELRRSYFASALNNIGETRETFQPWLSPIDKLRLELDEKWYDGASLLRMGGAKAFVGLARAFAEGSSAEPHQDILAWDAPELISSRHFKRQFAVNVYLQVSERGGTLQLWDRRLSREAYNAKRHSEPELSYAVRRDLLPAPDLQIAPQVAELVMFDCTRVHAVSQTEGSTRVSIAAFIGYRPGEPLQLWS